MILWFPTDYNNKGQGKKWGKRITHTSSSKFLWSKIRAYPCLKRCRSLCPYNKVWLAVGEPVFIEKDIAFLDELTTIVQAPVPHYLLNVKDPLEWMLKKYKYTNFWYIYETL